MTGRRATPCAIPTRTPTVALATVMVAAALFAAALLTSGSAGAAPPPLPGAPAATAPAPTATPTPSRTRPPSPPGRFVFTDDHHYYASPWYAGAWQEMIPFGCTEAPFYPRDRSCPRAKPGRHHGIDTFMPCGTRVRSAVRGVVVRGNLGSAYGRLALLIRAGRFDFVLGHVRRVFVRPGDRVRPGQLVARSGKLGAPDGCHLHFEKRPAGAGYLSAVDPLSSLHRRVVRF